MPPRSGIEVRDLLHAVRAGVPFLVYRDGSDRQIIRVLDGEPSLLTLGRHDSCHICLPWDERISGTHALLERLAQQWTISDDGFSRNGTYLNGARLGSRQRLAEGDTLRLGATLLTYRQPATVAITLTAPELEAVAVTLTPTQRKVLIALCRPFKEGSAYATPASNAQIAAELVVTIDAVKTHMRGLFERFSVGDLPQNQKRTRVVELAFESGIIREHDL